MQRSFLRFQVGLCPSLQNPAGRAIVMVAVAADGTLAGTRALFPWEVMVDGTRTKVAQSGRAWTRPEFQRQGVSVAIGRALQHAVAERGFPMMYSLPSARAVPGHPPVNVIEQRRLIEEAFR